MSIGTTGMYIKSLHCASGFFLANIQMKNQVPHIEDCWTFLFCLSFLFFFRGGVCKIKYVCTLQNSIEGKDFLI